MLSDHLRRYARACWEAVRPDLGEAGQAAQRELDQLTGDPRILMELTLGTLPASDVASVPFEVLLAYVRHALSLREHSPYCRDVPEDIFLHHVFYPRVNSEDLVDCRGFFAQMVAPEVEGLPGLEAALAVNRWCARQMTYETTDTRSMNPITCYYCGLGRCGEESTFGVTALRSVGIPARQIYVPWWSHCDDNHAWVEVYVEGDWHFLGACEPEPILDRGWFNSAASRAMVVCSRIFFDFIGEGLEKEALVQRQGMCLMYNQVSRYAETARLTVSVTDAQGAPLSGAWVRFYVLNMAAPARIAALETGPDGAVTLETGLGSLLVEAEQAGQFAWTTLDISKDAHCVMIPQAKGPEEESWTWDFSAPAAGEKTRRPLTPEQAQEKAEVLAAARQTRLARIDSYWSPRYQTGDDNLDRVFRMAGGNAEALWQFYQNTPEAEQPWAKALLLSLASKDWRDAKPEVLRAHLTAALALPGRDQPEFIPHVLCPRIGFELLTDWRTPILARLSPAEQDRFRQDPQALWAWVEAQFPEKQCRWHPVLWLQPGAALRLGASDAKGRRLLFVAILRTLGVPARLNPVDGQAQYWDGAAFVTVEAAGPAEPMAPLTIQFPEPLTYHLGWTLSRWAGGWQTLDLSGEPGPVYRLPLGQYRLTTVNRLPNGNQLARFTPICLPPEGVSVEATRRQGSLEQMLARFPIVPPVKLPGLQLQVYLEVGTEPTEHVLNELLESVSQVREAMGRGLKLLLLLPQAAARQDPTLGKVLAALPEATVLETDFASAPLDAMARALYVEPGLWPLTVLTDGQTAYYGHAGYAVGTIPLALNLVQALSGEANH